MPTRTKSRNDTKKEVAEEKCFQLALDVARRRGGGAYKIMSYLNGQNIDTRAKKDRPDLIRLNKSAFLVDPKGFEPSTSRMRTERSPKADILHPHALDSLNFCTILLNSASV